MVRFYNRYVTIGRRALAGLVVALLLIGAALAPAHAATQTIATTAAPVIWGQLRTGSVTIKTWNRSEVRIAAEPGVRVRHLDRIPGRGQVPSITFFAQTVQTPQGPLVLPPEPFIPQSFSTNGRDAVAFTGEGNVTMTIPAGSPLVVARVGRGRITIVGYHGGTFVTQMRAGIIRLNDVSGTGGVQLNNGPVIARNSTFERLRARTGHGTMFFENCTAKQIEATSLLGNIVYDNGSFTPGLARFESERGSIALGVRGGAQILAHSTGGKVLREGAISPGPTVTATSEHGDVLYYDGSLRQHPNLARRIVPKAFKREPLRKSIKRAVRRCCKPPRA